MQTHLAKNFLQLLRILSLAFSFSILAFMFLALWLRNSGELPASEPVLPLFQYVAMGGAVMMFGAGTVVFKKLLGGISPVATFSEKIKTYQSAFLVRTAMFEVPAITGLVMFCLGADYIILVLPGMFFALVLINFPTAGRIVNDLSLEGDERAIMENLRS